MISTLSIRKTRRKAGTCALHVFPLALSSVILSFCSVHANSYVFLRYSAVSDSFQSKPPLSTCFFWLNATQSLSLAINKFPLRPGSLPTYPSQLLYFYPSLCLVLISHSRGWNSILFLCKQVLLDRHCKSPSTPCQLGCVGD